MPKLYVFAVCEKVILDASGTPSLIALFNEMKAVIPSDVELPSNAVGPKDWAIFSTYEWEDTDEGKEYRQFIEIVYPDGKLFTPPQENKFVMQRDKRQQSTAQLSGFPLGQQGLYTVRLWLQHGDAIIIGPLETHIKMRHERQENPSLPPDSPTTKI
jgi:hypothetical protein